MRPTARRPWVEAETGHGEEAVACVAGEGVETPAVMRFCQNRLSSWQIPRDVWIVPEIPTNERGKISRRMLAERFLAHKGRIAKANGG